MKSRTSILSIVLLLMLTLFWSCIIDTSTETKSTTGVKKAQAKVKTQASGLTVEQENIKKRIEAENMPGAIKHLYILSAMSGQAIIYSTVKGKVTSSSKRLTPYSVACTNGQYIGAKHEGFDVRFNGHTKATGEVLQDDGSYGSSIPYLFWWDTKGVFHQHYVSGGQIIHIADKPMPIKSILINISK